MIGKALLWFFAINLAFGVVYRLWNVAEGEHFHKQTPVLNAIAAVVDAICLMLLLIYVL